MPPDEILLAILFFLAAALYSAVGHAGGSGFLASMAIVGVAPAAMRPTALVLNVLVASIATWRYARVGRCSWRLLWPFAAASVPASFAGGALPPVPAVYKVAVGGVLAVAAGRLALSGLRSPAASAPEEAPLPRPPFAAALAWGAVIGLLAGFTGTGGGIFLTPLVVLAGWATVKSAAGVSAAFILVNSGAGLAARPGSIGDLPEGFALWAAAAVAGALLGTELGTRRLAPRALYALLAAVLLIAAAKLIAF